MTVLASRLSLSFFLIVLRLVPGHSWLLVDHVHHVLQVFSIHLRKGTHIGTVNVEHCADLSSLLAAAGYNDL